MMHLLILLSENLTGWQPHFIPAQGRFGTNCISVNLSTNYIVFTTVFTNPYNCVPSWLVQAGGDDAGQDRGGGAAGGRGAGGSQPRPRAQGRGAGEGY